MKRRGPAWRLVMCVDNQGYAPDLQLRKIYEALPDGEAERHHEIRVIDESGEDYVFPASCFISIQIPRADEKKKAAKLLVSARPAGSAKKLRAGAQ